MPSKSLLALVPLLTLSATEVAWSNPPEAPAAFRCFERATSGAGLDPYAYLSKQRAAWLCSGAKGVAPAECYERAMRGEGLSTSNYLSQESAVRLCRRTDDAQVTLACYRHASTHLANHSPTWLLEPAEAAHLCSASP